MKIQLLSASAKLFFSSLFLCLFFEGTTYAQAPQTTISEYVLFGGTASSLPGQTTPSSPGYAVQLGSSSSIQVSSSGQAGSIGSYKLVKSTGNITVNANIYSGGTVQLSNSNTVSGKITAANTAILSGTIFSVGSSANLVGNIDVKGNIVVGGGTVSGRVTHPANTTYSGPNPAGGNVTGTPTLPVLPQMPAITSFPAAGSVDINTTRTITPGLYDEIELSGNKTLTFNGTGVYVFKECENSGTNNFVFNFNNSTSGTFKIYFHENVDLGKISVSMINGGSATRIFTEVHGSGCSGSPKYSFQIANGSSGGATTRWLGTVWAPYAAINIGSGTGNSSIIGALWSGTQVNIQSGVNIIYAPYSECTPPNANAGPDKPLDFENPTILTGSTTTSGVTYSWEAIEGGVITTPLNALSITVTSAGKYIFTVTSSSGCYTKDTAIVTGKVNDIIGSELQAVVQNDGAPSPFFEIQGEKIFIDVIVKTGEYAYVKGKLTAGAGPWFMTNLLGEDASSLIITGLFPINRLVALNTDPDLSPRIVYVRPYYRAFNNSVLLPTGKIAQGDTSVLAHLVRQGYDLSGDGIKIGVISNSFNTSAVSTSPVVNSDASQDIGNLDLPGPGNPNNTTPVTVLKESPFVRSDEGRAMLQIIHDIAPKAQLYFRTGVETANDFAAGIRELKAAGCDIITEDLTYITEPFLKDGVVAAAVQEVTSAGATYISSAGNFANKSFESPFNPMTAPGGLSGKAHNFSPSGTDAFLNVNLVPGSQYTIVLQWVDNIYSQGETAGTDYDLDIYLTPNTDGTALFGFNRKNKKGDPIEFLPFTYSGPASTNLLILNDSLTSSPARFKVVIFKGNITFNEYVTGGSTITGQSNAEGAISVGAVRYDKVSPYTGPLAIESFSSIGGTVVNNSPRNKPDLVAPDGVNTTVNMGSDYNSPNDEDNNYSNFFGTSAAAPHVAGVAALIMEGKKKFLNQTSVSSAEMKALLQSTSTDIGAPGFDFSSGAGLVNADAAMRTFAAPDPTLIQLVVPQNVTPGPLPFTLTVTGLNLSPTSVVTLGGTPLTTNFVNSGNLTANVPAFIGDPAIIVNTPPLITNGIDGGTSEPLQFTDVPKRKVVVKADNKSKKYAQNIPAFTATITVDGKTMTELIAESGQTEQQILQVFGLDVVTYTLPNGTNENSNIGNYTITPGRTFDEQNPADVRLQEIYEYTFNTGDLTIEKLAVTVTAQNLTAVYGEKLPDIDFSYAITNAADAATITNPQGLLSSLQTSHQSKLKKDAQGHDIIGLVNGQAVTIENGQAVTIENGQAVTIENGQAVTIENSANVHQPIVNGQAVTIENGIVTDTSGRDLTPADIVNLSFLATDRSLQNARQITNQKLVNGTYITNSTSVVDIAQESILAFKVNSAQTYMVNAISGASQKGLVDKQSYENGQAVTIENGQAVTIENGQAVTIENAQIDSIIKIDRKFGMAGTLSDQLIATIENGQAVTIENGQAVTIENGQAVTIENGVSAPLTSSQNRTAVILDKTDIGQVHQNNLMSVNVVTGLDVGEQFIIPGSLVNNNLEITNIAGIATILPAPVIITPAANQSKVFGNIDPVLAYTNNAGLTTDDFTGTLGRVSGDNVGTYNYALGNLSAGANYTLALSGEEPIATFAITARPITITPDANQSKVYGNADPTFTYTASEALQTGSSYSGALSRVTVSINNIGTYAFTLGTLSAGSNYTLTLGGTNTFAIAARPITITPNTGQSKVYGNADPTFTYTASEALQSGDSYSGGLSRVNSTVNNAGTYAFTLGTLSAGSNYTLSLGGANTFAITERPITITPNTGQSKVYGNADPTFTYTTSEALQSGDSYSGALSRVNSTVNNVGTYAFTLGSLTAGSNYTLTLGGAKTFAITARPITITPNTGQTKVYGNADPTFTYTASEALQSGDSYSGALSRVNSTVNNVGTYAFTLGTLSAGSNYTLTLGGANTFAITKKPITITPNAGQSKVYGNADPTFTYTASATLQSGDSYSGALSRVNNTINNVGTYAYTLGTLSAGNNYTLTLGGTNTFAITKAPLQVKADLKWINKGSPLPTFTSVITGLKYTDNPTVTHSLSPSCAGAAGVYTIIPLLTNFANSVNYTITYINSQLYINPKGSGADDVDTYLECVEDRGASYTPANRRYVARFYAKNTNSTPVYVPIGVNNKLSSTGSFDGSQQAVIFLPGNGTTRFNVPFDGVQLKWELKTYEGNTLVTESCYRQIYFCYM